MASDGVEPLRLVIEDGDVSTVQSIGALSYLYHADGGTAVYQRVGDMSLILDSRPGRSGIAHHLGDMAVILRDNGVSYCRILRDVMNCHRQQPPADQVPLPESVADSEFQFSVWGDRIQERLSAR